MLQRSRGYIRNRNLSRGGTGQVGRVGEGEGAWACTARSQSLLLRGVVGGREVMRFVWKMQAGMTWGCGDGIWGYLACRGR